MFVDDHHGHGDDDLDAGQHDGLRLSCTPLPLPLRSRAPGRGLDRLRASESEIPSVSCRFTAGVKRYLASRSILVRRSSSVICRRRRFGCIRAATSGNLSTGNRTVTPSLPSWWTVAKSRAASLRAVGPGLLVTRPRLIRPTGRYGRPGKARSSTKGQSLGRGGRTGRSSFLRTDPVALAESFSEVHAIHVPALLSGRCCPSLRPASMSSMVEGRAKSAGGHALGATFGGRHLSKLNGLRLTGGLVDRRFMGSLSPTRSCKVSTHHRG